jgi:hypothetical protein
VWGHPQRSFSTSASGVRWRTARTETSGVCLAEMSGVRRVLSLGWSDTGRLCTRRRIKRITCLAASGFDPGLGFSEEGKRERADVRRR